VVQQDHQVVDLYQVLVLVLFNNLVLMLLKPFLIKQMLTKMVQLVEMNFDNGLKVVSIQLLVDNSINNNNNNSSSSNNNKRSKYFIVRRKSLFFKFLFEDLVIQFQLI
jgi:hypothetical protein